MSEEKSPNWKPSELKANTPVSIVLKSAKPVASGENKWGTWNLWIIEVENETVYDRDGKKTTGYTGEATCFPSKTLHEQFIKITGEKKEDMKISITLVPVKGEKGFYTSYEVKVIGEGSVPNNNLTKKEYDFINDYLDFAKNNMVNFSKDDMVAMAKTDTYNMNVDLFDIMWEIIKEKQTKKK